MDSIQASAPTFHFPAVEASAYGDWNPEAPSGPGAASHPRRALVVAGITAAVLGLGAFLVIRGLTTSTTTGEGAGGPGGPGFRGGGGPGTGGTIASINGATLSLTTASGSPLTVRTNSSTTVTRSSTGAVGRHPPG